jgi:hypothetical protein
MTAPITLSSLDSLSTHLPPSTPAEYLRYVIITTLRRKGYNAAEAGALAEMERLVEHRKLSPSVARPSWPGPSKEEGTEGSGMLIQLL